MVSIDRRAALAGAATFGLAACATLPPPSADAFGDLDGVSLASRIRAGEITALEAVEAAIARAERLQPQVNFLVTPLFEEARARPRGPLQGPFAGLPTLVKDLTDLEGAPTRYGCRAFKDAPPQPRSTDFVAAMLRAGLVPIGKSTSPEFGFTATTEPLLTGATRNPWSLDHSVGGSSGGAAAAVAAGIVPVAHASDGGGSIRIPASCCGLFGLKPSRGRLIRATDPQPAPIDLSVDGCVSRSVRDTAAWLAALQRRDEAAPFAALRLVSGPSRERLRIAVATRDPLGREPDPQVRAAVESAGRLCETLGHSVFEGGPRLDGEAVTEAFALYWAAGAAQTLSAVRRQAPDSRPEDLFEPFSLGLAELAAAAPAGAVEEAILALRTAVQSFTEAFAGYDILLTPTLGAPPPEIGYLDPRLPFGVQQERLTRYATFTPLQNAAGVPAMSVPLGASGSGLPIGVQFTAAAGQEEKLLALAFALEEAQPWRNRRQGVFA